MIGSISPVLERKIHKHFSSVSGSRVKSVRPICHAYGWWGQTMIREGSAMRRNEKSWMELDELLEPFLPAEHAETGAPVAVEFRNRLVKLEQQVMSQYTSMAMYATIAKQDSEAVKGEAPPHLARSPSTSRRLTEKPRNQIKTRL